MSRFFAENADRSLESARSSAQGAPIRNALTLRKGDSDETGLEPRGHAGP
jgi:hypothetical protein